MSTGSVTLRLPAGHALDWWDRLGEGLGAEILAQTARTVTLRLPSQCLRDLISDAVYYAEEMDPTNTEGVDYRPKARTLLRAIERAGIRYTVHGFIVTIESVPQP